MNDIPLISVCIPAYKRADFLHRLLESIRIQSFNSYEVVVTDDSPDDSIKELCEKYAGLCPLRYYKNDSPLGTPENWNEAIRHANGKWIKIMHDDDWFADPDSLGEFYRLTETPILPSFVFSGSAIIENGKHIGSQQLSSLQKRLISKDPQNLFSKNVIGPPSVVMYKNDKNICYDNRMKWLVDIDFYIRYLQHNPQFNYTRNPLINVGFSEVQVTKEVLHDKKVVIPENLLLISKLNPQALLKIRNYDFCWRLIRNYRIKSKEEIISLNIFVEHIQIPELFVHIISWQKRISFFLLRIGIISKTLMLLNYCFYFVYRVRS